MSISMTSSLKRLVVAGAALAVIAGPALAQPVLETFSFRYAYNGADLRSVSGARAVYADLSVKARNACRSNNRLVLEELRTLANCANNLVNQTVAAIDSPRLTQVHTGQATIELATR